MELLSIYEFIMRTMGGMLKIEPTDFNYGHLLLFSAAASVVVGLIFFAFQSIAVFCMAKRRNLPKAWLAFLPFANIILMGKLAGEISFFGQKMKRAGLYAMLAQIFMAVLSCLYISSEVYLHRSGCIGYEYIEDGLEKYRMFWNGGTSFQKFLFEYFFDLVSMLHMIFGLLCEILMLILLSALCKKYAPDGGIWRMILIFIIPISRCIILFTLRNRKAVDYAAYMREKQQRYWNYYRQQGGGYGPQNPQTPPYGTDSTPRQEEPFSEFSSDKNNEDPFSDI